MSAAAWQTHLAAAGSDEAAASGVGGAVLRWFRLFFGQSSTDCRRYEVSWPPFGRGMHILPQGVHLSQPLSTSPSPRNHFDSLASLHICRFIPTRSLCLLLLHHTLRSACSPPLPAPPPRCAPPPPPHSAICLLSSSSTSCSCFSSLTHPPHFSAPPPHPLSPSAGAAREGHLPHPQQAVCGCDPQGAGGRGLGACGR
jgi:hypothetical protein